MEIKDAVQEFSDDLSSIFGWRDLKLKTLNSLKMEIAEVAQSFSASKLLESPTHTWYTRNPPNPSKTTRPCKLHCGLCPFAYYIV